MTPHHLRAAIFCLAALLLADPGIAFAHDSTQAPAEGLEHADLEVPGPAIGMVLAWPAAQAPASEAWLECDGSTFEAQDYPELAALLGSSTLPDYRGRFLRGAGSQTVEDGEDEATLSSGDLGLVQEAALGAHVHALATTSPLATTDDELSAQGSVTATVPVVTTTTVTTTASTSGITTTSDGRNYNESANYPYNLFPKVIAKYCDSTCDCYCLGGSYDWCGTPGRWLSSDLSSYEEVDSKPSGYSSWKVLARASFYLTVGSTAVSASYKIYCKPHETTTTTTVTSYDEVEEDMTFTFASSLATLGLAGGADTMESAATGSGSAPLPVHAPVRWFIRAR